MAGCTACSKEAEPGQRLKNCGRCSVAAYCSRECQRADWPTHMNSCKRPNYILRIQLCPAVESMQWRLQAAITDPPVERILSCPAHATFDDLHHALQIAFGWSTTHTYSFVVLDPTYRDSDDYKDPTGGITKMIMQTQGKRADSAREYSMRILDKTIDPGMFLDKMHDNLRQHPRTIEKQSTTTKLFQNLEKPPFVDGRLVYEYDYGDRWVHLITVIGREPSTDRFRCVDGTGHPVAEDVTQKGRALLKEAYRTSTPDPEQRETREWFERRASNGNPRGLGGGREYEWDRAGVEMKLSVRVVR